MILTVQAESLDTGETKTFYVDNLTLKIADAPFEGEALPQKPDFGLHHKTHPIRRLKIQLGLSCNYECSYCSQSAVNRPPTTGRKDIDGFMEQIKNAVFADRPTVEFWGGEPVLYWKTLKPLAERMREFLPNARFSMITNGSLLTKDKIDWLDAMGFGISMSHDGPGQALRGPDILDDEEKLEVVKYALEKLGTKGRFGFSAVLNAKNPSRSAIIEWFRTRFPDARYNLNELDLISVYHEGGSESLQMTEAESIQLRRNLWAEARFLKNTVENASAVRDKVQQVVLANQPDSVLRPVKGQKCGMDRPGSIAVDLKGNVITCQNVSATQVAENGHSHKIGTLDDLARTPLATSTHWADRPNCSGCPVLALCNGTCMILQGDHFNESCNAAFTEHIANFALGFESVTGFIPTYIEGEHLPEFRRDVWGARYTPAKPKRVIPIVQV